VPRSKLAAQVAERLLEEIVASVRDAGTRMPSEHELMAALDVGRSLDPTAGTAAQSAIATALARGVTRDLFEARRLVEPESARLAAEHRTAVIALEDHAAALRTGAPAKRI
jgi:DNA-binding FadR family transcriptional regulator